MPNRADELITTRLRDILILVDIRAVEQLPSPAAASFAWARRDFRERR